MDRSTVEDLAKRVKVAFATGEWRQLLETHVPATDLLSTKDVALLLGRDKDTISWHARRSRHTEDMSPIGTRLSAHQWVFNLRDVLSLAEIVARGPGRRPRKLITPPADVRQAS